MWQVSTELEEAATRSAPPRRPGQPTRRSRSPARAFPLAPRDRRAVTTPAARRGPWQLASLGRVQCEPGTGRFGRPAVTPAGELTVRCF